MILMYHKVGLESPTMWWVTVNDFYDQMFELQNKTVVYLDDYDPENSNHVVITFDGVYQNVLHYAAPIIQKFGYPFELFITSDYLNANNDFDTVEPTATFASIDELHQLEKLGGRIQWHTQSHPDMKSMTEAALIEKELSIPADVKVFDEHSFKWFAYPYGNFNSTVLTAVQSKFHGAVSCIQGSDTNKHALNRITVTNETQFNTQTITCIITSYNYGHFLAEAIESVLRQTIMPHEIIIANDCSTDMTEEIALEYQHKHPKLIKYFKNPVNLGIVENFNKAVALAKGSYIVFLGADNCFQSNYFEECAAILNKDNNIGVAYTDYVLFGSRANAIYNSFASEYKGEVRNGFYRIRFPDADEVDLVETLKKQNVIHGSSMYRREAFNKIGSYKKTEQMPEDYNLFIRMLNLGYTAKKASNTLLQYRQHSHDQANHAFGTQSLVNFYMAKSKRLESELNFLKKYKIVSAVSLGFKIKNSASRLLTYARKNGVKSTIKRIIK
jgi:glycosyltransferase involved in cell wall biosynthesis/peptidoglycan/xylan/chitin deacetylase (PgdA/CDA1 family)